MSATDLAELSKTELVKKAEHLQRRARGLVERAKESTNKGVSVVAAGATGAAIGAAEAMYPDAVGKGVLGVPLEGVAAAVGAVGAVMLDDETAQAAALGMSCAGTAIGGYKLAKEKVSDNVSGDLPKSGAASRGEAVLTAAQRAALEAMIAG